MFKIVILIVALIIALIIFLKSTNVFVDNLVYIGGALGVSHVDRLPSKKLQ